MSKSLFFFLSCVCLCVCVGGGGGGCAYAREHAPSFRLENLESQIDLLSFLSLGSQRCSWFRHWQWHEECHCQCHYKCSGNSAHSKVCCRWWLLATAGSRDLYHHSQCASVSLCGWGGVFCVCVCVRERERELVQGVGSVEETVSCCVLLSLNVLFAE